jgi:hypothetical protein
VRQKKCKGTKDARNCNILYSGVKQNTRTQSRAILWIHKTLTKASFGINYRSEISDK